MKSSNETSQAQPRPSSSNSRSSDRSSATSSRPSPTSADQFALAGPSDPPDPAFHAFRNDLADAELAGRVIASHYAEPVERHLAEAAELRAAPATDADVIASLDKGAPFALLDDTLGWAWGYAGEERRVGYVESAKIAR